MKISGFLCPHCGATLETELTQMTGANYRERDAQATELWALFDKYTGGSWSGSNLYGKVPIQCPNCGGECSILVGIWIAER